MGQASLGLGPREERGARIAGSSGESRADPRRAELPALRGLVGIERSEFEGVVEHAAVVAIDKGLGRRALRQDYVMGIKFNVEIFELVNSFDLPDRRSVHEQLSGNEQVLDKEGVFRRHLEVAGGHTLGERAGLDPGLAERSGCPEQSAGHAGAPPDPFDPAGRT